MHYLKKNKDGMHRCGSVGCLVLICQTEASAAAESGFLALGVSCVQRQDGDRRVVSNLRACSRRASGCRVFRGVCFVFPLFFSSHPPAAESADAVPSPVHLPTGGAGGAPLIMAEGGGGDRGQFSQFREFGLNLVHEHSVQELKGE